MTSYRLKVYVLICVISNFVTALAVYYLSVPGAGADQLLAILKLLIIVVVLTILHQGSWVPFIRGLKKWARQHGDEDGAKAGLHRIFQVIWRNAFQADPKPGRNCFIAAALSFGVMEMILAYYLIAAVVAVLKPGMWVSEVFFYLRILSLISAVTVLVSVKPFFNYIDKVSVSYKLSE